MFLPRWGATRRRVPDRAAAEGTLESWHSPSPRSIPTAAEAHASLQPSADFLGDFRRRESEMLGDLLERRRGSETIDADHQRIVSDVFVPACCAACFDCHDASAIADGLILIVRRLT